MFTFSCTTIIDSLNVLAISSILSDTIFNDVVLQLNAAIHHILGCQVNICSASIICGHITAMSSNSWVVTFVVFHMRLYRCFSIVLFREFFQSFTMVFIDDVTWCTRCI